MSRRVLACAKCSQMSDPFNGKGSGGDRCTEACAAIINVTYKIGPSAQAGATPESIMYDFTRWLNNGNINSAPENAIWISDWVSQHSNGAITLADKQWPSFQDVVDCVNRNHIAVGGFDDYAQLKLADGSNPYLWHDPPGLGHVLIIVGYDMNNQTVIVHDPLRADPSGQPADYSWAGFQAARFHDLIEVNGPALPVIGGSMAPKSLVWFTFGQGPLAGKGLADVEVDLGISIADLKSIPENHSFATYGDTAADVAGMEIAVPGYPPAAAPVPASSGASDADKLVAAVLKVFPHLA